ncbi:hypothetical protein GMOD_00003799 [Pyrenophora seminiperda CCB06]
MYNSI